MRASSRGWRASSWSRMISRLRMNDPAKTGWPWSRLEYRWRRSAVSAGRNRTLTTRPSRESSRRNAALMDLLELRGRPRSKIGRVLNLHIVLRLDRLHEIVELFRTHGLGDRRKYVAERLKAHFLGANQVKAARLLDWCTNFPLLQREDRGLDGLRVAATGIDGAEVAVLRGRCIVRIFARQFAEIGAALDLLRQIFNLRLGLGLGGQLLAVRGGLPGCGVERHVDNPNLHFLNLSG